MISLDSYFNIDSQKPLIIAETAFSHEGSIDYLYNSVENLSFQKNIAIKYQILINKKEYLSEYSEMYNTVDKWLFSYEEWSKLIDFTYERKLPVIVAVLDSTSLDLVYEKRELISAIEIHPSCVPDVALMRKIISLSESLDKPIIIGISGFSIEEIEYLMSTSLRNVSKNKLVFMYGFQNYPTDITSVKFSRLKLIREKFQVKLGYADHTEFNNDIKEIITSFAYGMGCNIIEIHYVLKKGIERVDFVTATDAEGIIYFRDNLKSLFSSIGTDSSIMSIQEERYSMKFRKNPVYTESLSRGHQIVEEDIIFKRTLDSTGMKLFDINKIVGQILNENVTKDKEIRLEELKKK